MHASELRKIDLFVATSPTFDASTLQRLGFPLGLTVRRDTYPSSIHEGDNIQNFNGRETDLIGTVARPPRFPFYFGQETTNDQVELLKLPSVMGARLRAYIKNRPREPFDCESFAYYMNGMPHAYQSWKLSDFNVHTTTPVDLKKLKPGVTIFYGKIVTDNLNRRTAYPKHFAISLGGGLTISKLGSHASVHVVDVLELQKAYRAEGIYLFTPKNVYQKGIEKFFKFISTLHRLRRFFPL